MVAETVVWDSLAGAIRGRVVFPGDACYDEVRQVRNGLIDRRPAVIVQCSDTTDVVHAVEFARAHDLLISVRGGGHNVAGNAMNDGGLVIDLSHMRAVHVDPVRRIARIQGGATWADVDRETQPFGLATTGGQVSSTGVGGLTLHGGMGTLHRTFGLAIDNLRSAEVVTASGEVLVASATEHPDLFWAIRGAGSNFGVVTWMELALHPLGPEIVMAVPVFPLEDAGRILRTFRDFADAAPNSINPQAFVLSLPPDDDLPPELHDRPALAVQVLYAGDPDDADAALSPVYEWGDPLLDLGGRMTYVASQSGFDAMFPKGWHYYWKSHLLPELTDEQIDTIVEIGFDRPSPRAIINIWPLGGAIGEVAPTATPWWRRDARYLLSLDTSWIAPSESERCIAWTRAMWERTKPAGQNGLYLNFAGFGEEREALVEAAYGDNYGSLRQLKTRYDPRNLFRMNNNVRPV